MRIGGELIGKRDFFLSRQRDTETQGLEEQELNSVVNPRKHVAGIALSLIFPAPPQTL